jgi:hypothetical protein
MMANERRIVLDFCCGDRPGIALRDVSNLKQLEFPLYPDGKPCEWFYNITVEG